MVIYLCSSPSYEYTWRGDAHFLLLYSAQWLNCELGLYVNFIHNAQVFVQNEVQLGMKTVEKGLVHLAQRDFD